MKGVLIMNVAKVMDGYLACALWSETDDAENPLDANWEVGDITTEAVAEMRGEVEDFLALIERERPMVIDEMENGFWSDPAQVGHDFWLTRNGHGAGFWDRGQGELGAFLTKWAKTYGGSHLYVGDDRKIHVM